jgi:hypothetical protein
VLLRVVAQFLAHADPLTLSQKEIKKDKKPTIPRVDPAMS